MFPEIRASNSDYSHYGKGDHSSIKVTSKEVFFFFSFLFFPINKVTHPIGFTHGTKLPWVPWNMPYRTEPREAETIPQNCIYGFFLPIMVFNVLIGHNTYKKTANKSGYNNLFLSYLPSLTNSILKQGDNTDLCFRADKSSAGRRWANQGIVSR